MPNSSPPPPMSDDNDMTLMEFIEQFDEDANYKDILELFGGLEGKSSNNITTDILYMVLNEQKELFSHELWDSKFMNRVVQSCDRLLKESSCNINSKIYLAILHVKEVIQICEDGLKQCGY